MLDAVRFNLKRGASQIKLLMGGGVASTYDPLDVITKDKIMCKETIDATGYVVAPGFIGTHTHALDGVGVKMAAMLDSGIRHLSRHEEKAGADKQCRFRVYRSCSGNVRIFFMGQTEICFERG